MCLVFILCIRIQFYIFASVFIIAFYHFHSKQLFQQKWLRCGSNLFFAFFFFSFLNFPVEIYSLVLPGLQRVRVSQLIMQNFTFVCMRWHPSWQNICSTHMSICLMCVSPFMTFAGRYVHIHYYIDTTKIFSPVGNLQECVPK